MKKERVTLWVSPAVFEFLKDKKMSCLTTILHKQKGEDRPIPIYIELETADKEKNNG